MPGVLQELREHVAGLPVVDIHTHINPENPQASKPEDILLYHYIATELTTAGVPRRLVEEGDVSRLLDRFRLIRNTSTYWCLLRILKGVYGLGEWALTPEGWEEARGIMESKSKNPGWAAEILNRKVRARRVFITMNYSSPIPSYDPKVFVGSLRIDPLVSSLSPESLKRLCERTGVQAETVDELREALATLFKIFNGHVKTVTISLQPEDRFKPPDRFEAGQALARLLRGLPLRRGELVALSSYMAHEVLSLCENHGLTVQLMLGVRRPVPGASPPDRAIVVHSPDALTNYCRSLFARFGDVRFDILSAGRVYSHEISVIAKNYPNVYFSGFWWYSFYPSIIVETLLERVQMLPRNKVCGFFSDAYVVEWIYGKLSLVREQIAQALAWMVKRRYYTMELAEELAEDLLHGNPTRIYGL